MKLISPRSNVKCHISRRDPAGNVTRSSIEIDATSLVNAMYQMGVSTFREMPRLTDSYFDSPARDDRPFNTRIRIAKIDDRLPGREDYARLCEHLVIDMKNNNLDLMRDHEATRIFLGHNFGEAARVDDGQWEIPEKDIYSRTVTLMDPGTGATRKVMFEIEFQEDSSLPVFLKPNVIEMNDDPEPEVSEMNTPEKLYGYYVNLDERGEFYADVRDHQENSVFELRSGPDGTIDLIEDGYMKHKTDLDGLEAYLKEISILSADAELLTMSEFEERLEDDEPDAEMAM
jgi:hypothetical protein